MTTHTTYVWRQMTADQHHLVDTSSGIAVCAAMRTGPYLNDTSDTPFWRLSGRIVRDGAVTDYATIGQAKEAGFAMLDGER